VPSFFEAAAFSLHVYRDSDQPPLPEGWSLLMDCPTAHQLDGYFGAVYAQCIDTEDQIYDVVIAHRGTSNFPDFIEDLELFISQKVPAQFLASAVPFVLEAIAFLDQKYGRIHYSITFTGHSLGASMAELCVAQWCNPDELTTMGLTFESPGSKPLIMQLIQQGRLPAGSLEYAASVIATCNADVNAINSCLEHIASPNGPFYIGYSYVSSDLSDYPIPPDQVYFFLDFTWHDQHQMVKMYNYWKSSADLEHLKKIKNNVSTSSGFTWPIGVSNAFDYYMTYLPNRGEGPEVEHQEYWDSYIQKCWNESALIRMQYKNNQDAFSTSFIQTHLKQDPQPSPPLLKLRPTAKKTRHWLYAIHSLFGLLILAELVLALPLGFIEYGLLLGMDTGINRFPELPTRIISTLFLLALFGCPLSYIFSLVRSIQIFKLGEYKKSMIYAFAPLVPFVFLFLIVLISNL